MRNQQKLLIEQLDKKLQPFYSTEKITRPSAGWLQSVRTTFNMTLEQVSNKLNTTPQAVKQIEKREATESITLKALKNAAQAMDMQLVYAIIPKEGTLQSFIDIKAKELAKKIVLRTNQTMKLENQENNQEQIRLAIAETAEEIKREMPKILWD